MARKRGINRPKKSEKRVKSDWFEKLRKHFLDNLNFYLSFLVSIVLSLGVWFYFSNNVTRFTFIMPIMATWIFYLILTEVDDRD